MTKTFALIGNQNSGKTTLFNRLTGSSQHVGNFPGVTVEKKSGFIRRHNDIELVDLPGIYSLSPYSAEEQVTLDFLIKENVQCIINIVDATNIERNLYLTLQVLELGIPTVLALNMMDEVVSCGNSIDVAKLEEQLGIPVVPISAGKNSGIDDLVDKMIETAGKQEKPAKYDFCTGEVHRAIHSVAHIIEEKAVTYGIPVRFAASKIVEGDHQVIVDLGLTPSEIDIIGHITAEMEELLGIDRESALADMRYAYIENICSESVIRLCTTTQQQNTLKIDRWLTHKILALPIFIGIMTLVFYLTFGLAGSFLSGSFTLLIDKAVVLAGNLMRSVNVNETIQSLVIDGVLSGVGSVLSFLPTILILFFFLSILEDTGYMARVAFVMDKLLRRIGLSGRSFVPMLIGFGCSVPAIMATRTLTSSRDRKMTIILIPFMSCSAKVPIYVLFTAAFFSSGRAVVMTALYFTGMLVAVLVGLLLKRFLFKGEPTPFIMELPAYRFPSPKSILLNIYEKAKDFVQRAFTIILIASVVIWLLQSFDFGLNRVVDGSTGMLARIGSAIAPIFAPLGFGDWRSSTALITGLTAKEAVVSTFAVLTSSADNNMLISSIQNIFTPLQAMSFLVFTLLYMPCVAALAAVRRELHSLPGAVLIMLSQTSIAWVAAFAVYQTGLLLGF